MLRGMVNRFTLKQKPTRGHNLWNAKGRMWCFKTFCNSSAWIINSVFMTCLMTSSLQMGKECFSFKIPWKWVPICTIWRSHYVLLFNSSHTAKSVMLCCRGNGLSKSELLVQRKLNTNFVSSCSNTKAFGSQKIVLVSSVTCMCIFYLGKYGHVSAAQTKVLC